MSPTETWELLAVSKTHISRPMTLKDWLAETSTPYHAFAPRIGVANASVVQKYASGRVPRSREVRAAIVRETEGRVQLSDLYAEAAQAA